MAILPFAAGACAGVALIALLAATLAGDRIRIWPTPRPGSWESRTFWVLFRTLNLTALAAAALGSGSLELTPIAMRGAGLAVAALCGVLYVRSLISLGPPNTYCRRAGLVERGAYRWTRNPQYASVIPAYAGLAVAADSAAAWCLIGLLTVVYVLMAYAEEPWLRAAYPDAYARYARRVPRFYNWRRARALLRLGRQRARHPVLRRSPTARAKRAAASGLPRWRA